MKAQVFNPYLPSYEYIPDGEPHIFNGRVYVYGSHDKFNGNNFCMNDYVTWSAPVDDLSSWRYEGVIYSKVDDPYYKGGYMYAPDVCQGPDGKYYIYYAFAPGITQKSWEIRVAKADSPIGPFSFHGKVNLNKWTKEYLPFDPAVYVENNHVYLYYGSGMFFPVLGVNGKKIKGGAVVELDPVDMKTVITSPIQTMPSNDDKLKSHAFFEASSMRKIKDKYYFIYSSKAGHELCYSIGDTPVGPFSFGGVLVSNGDIGLGNHKDPKSASNYTGNTHGSILEANGKYYIFYHRQTNRNCFSRQDCAEEIFMEDDGSFKQAEITSCGLNGKPLEGKGEYEARIACNLTSKKGGRFYGSIFKKPKGCHPFFTQFGKDREDTPNQYIDNFCDGACAGFKYFNIASIKRIGVKVLGNAKGTMIVSNGKDTLSEIKITPCKEATYFFDEYKGSKGISALYFTFLGKGKMKFFAIKLD